ncbi:MAG TPA: S49 family peptidase [Bacteroidia bacterium]|nr:S49 family peptidase [Bacteroidia bacterium]
MKQYPRIFQEMYCEPLCVEVAVFHSAHAAIWPRFMNGQGLDIGGIAAAEKPTLNKFTGRRASWCGPTREDNRFYWTVEGRPEIGVVPVYGILAKNASWMEEACYGITDINGISHALGQVAAAKDVKTLILDLASPGGQVTGIRELGNMVSAITAMRGKTVYAFTDDRCCSAAYWIASQADEIYGTPSATVGSIGTYLAWLDESVRMQIEGVRLEFFGAGKYKGMGLPGKQLTQEDRALLQARVDEINGWFTSAVTSKRPKISGDTMQGQTFTGEQSVGVHLLDGLVNDWNEFLALI